MKRANYDILGYAVSKKTIKTTSMFFNKNESKDFYSNSEINKL